MWLGLLGLASGLCVFISEFPYSLVPFAVFLFIALPGPDPVQRAAERRASRAVRKSSFVRKRARERTAPVRTVRILDPEESPAESDRDGARREERVLEENVV
jgi:hypothetical protein